MDLLSVGVINVRGAEEQRAKKCALLLRALSTNYSDCRIAEVEMSTNGFGSTIKLRRDLPTANMLKAADARGTYSPQLPRLDDCTCWEVYSRSKQKRGLLYDPLDHVAIYELDHGGNQYNPSTRNDPYQPSASTKPPSEVMVERYTEDIRSTIRQWRAIGAGKTHIAETVREGQLFNLDIEGIAVKVFLGFLFLVVDESLLGRSDSAASDPGASARRLLAPQNLPRGERKYLVEASSRVADSSQVPLAAGAMARLSRSLGEFVELIKPPEV